MPDVAIVGGGITGLATAWFLRAAQPELTVTLLEAADRLGGKISTTEWLGVPVEAGPDTFLARVPAVGRAFLWTRGHMRPLPEGHVLGVPGRLGPVLRSGLLSPAGMARAALDLVLPRRALGPDPSVGEVVGGRFGREVVDRLVDPVLGGVHAGSTDRLSLASVAPNVAEAAARNRSLLLGLRSAGQPPRVGSNEGGSRPVFMSVRGGLERLVRRLRERLDGVDIRVQTQVERLDRAPTGGWRLSCAGGASVDASSVVLTVPAFVASPLLRPVSPDASSELDSIRHASVVTVTFAYRRADVPDIPDGSGFLVPAVDGRLMTACTFLTKKWPDLAGSGRVLFRVSAGRSTDERALALDDDTLATRLHRDDLAQALALRGEPEDVVVVRWPRAFPQYEVGHRDRVARIEQSLASAAPGVLLAGAAYRGLGIAACVQQAEQVAGRAGKELADRS